MEEVKSFNVKFEIFLEYLSLDVKYIDRYLSRVFLCICVVKVLYRGI